MTAGGAGIVVGIVQLATGGSSADPRQQQMNTGMSQLYQITGGAFSLAGSVVGPIAFGADPFESAKIGGFLDLGASVLNKGVSHVDPTRGHLDIVRRLAPESWDQAVLDFSYETIKSHRLPDPGSFVGPKP